jgi:nucleotide-binding universal stress UspA family protein
MEDLMSFAAMMVHLDVERDCEQRVQLALDLAHRFEAALIGVAGMPLRPKFSAGGIVVYGDPSEEDRRAVGVRFEEMGRKFCVQGQHLKQVEWRTALELPADLVAREARAADLVILGPRHTSGPLCDLIEPGVVLLRVGRPILVVPETVTPLQLRRVVVACKDTRECRRAIRDALPFLRRARQVLLVEIGEESSKTQEKTSLADIARYLARHDVIIADEIWRRARGPAASELVELVRSEKADLVVAGGYGHSRLGEWIYGGVTHELLSSNGACCMLSH